MPRVKSCPAAAGYSTFCPFPEGPCFADLLQGLDHLRGVFKHVRNVIRIQAATEIRPRKKFHHIRERRNAFIAAGGKRSPVANMLFRPEEIHRASGMSHVFKPFPERDGHVSRQSRSFAVEKLSVADGDAERLAAIEAGKIDADRFTGE